MRPARIETPIMLPEEVAAWLHISRNQVLKLARAGVLPGFRLISEWRFHRRRIAEFITRSSNGHY